ncbi:MAG: Fmu (Sun) domain protein, partial [Chitinophagaceae bacterium]
LEALRPQWNALAAAEFTLKLKEIDPGLHPTEFFAKLFPWQDQLSPEIDAQQFSQRLLAQPRVFLRIRPGRKEYVLSSLYQSGITAEELSESAWAVPADTRIPPALVPDRDLVVQDLNSQRVAELFPVWTSPQPIRVWDSCAGGGGKALLAADHYPNLNLTVTDNRKYSLQRLQERMQVAGFRSVKEYCVDLAERASWPEALGQRVFDLILADVPCSGSGTWARSPEQISFFTRSKLEAYVSLQRKILHQLVRQVAPGGNLLYVTCSVFQEENEHQVNYLLQQSGVNLLRQVYFKGYERGGDTLFGALFSVSGS